MMHRAKVLSTARMCFGLVGHSRGSRGAKHGGAKGFKRQSTFSMGKSPVSKEVALGSS